MLLSTSVYIVNNMQMDFVVADNSVRNIGVLFDSLALVPGHVEVNEICPGGTVIAVNGSRITMKAGLLGQTEGTYYYITPKNATLPNVEIDCDDADIDYIRMTKDINFSTMKTTIGVEGYAKE